MGKIDAESSIAHFSHPHPLKLISYQPSTTKNRINCLICAKEASGLIYTCESCNYSLHRTCSNMPEKLNHKSDPNHALTLLPAPAYALGSFKCDACGALGTGFCYHCEDCQLDLHTVCAFMRSCVKSPSHEEHTLEIFFEPPYENKAFVCDVCGGRGSNHWLYRCELCEFDAHLKCAKTPKSNSKVMDEKAQSSSRILKNKNPQMVVKSRSVHSPASSWSRTENYNFQATPRAGFLYGPEPYPYGPQSLHQLHPYETAPVLTSTSFVQQQPTRNDAVQNVVQSVIEGLIEGGANQVGQALLQAALGN